MRHCEIPLFARDDTHRENTKPADYIKGSRIIFRPEAVLNREIKREMTLKRVSSEVME